MSTNIKSTRRKLSIAADMPSDIEAQVVVEAVTEQIIKNNSQIIISIWPLHHTKIIINTKNHGCSYNLNKIFLCFRSKFVLNLSCGIIFVAEGAPWIFIRNFC